MGHGVWSGVLRKQDVVEYFDILICYGAHCIRRRAGIDLKINISHFGGAVL
jgi:hypothetical protein